MRAVGHLIVRLIAVLFGLAVAFMAAALFLAFGLYTEMPIGVHPPDSGHGPEGLLVLVVSLVTSPFIAAAAFGPSALLVAFAEGFRLRGLTINLLLGALVALIVAWLHGDIAPREMSTGALVVLLASGFVGGFAYWLIAGRNAGRWLDRPGR